MLFSFGFFLCFSLLILSIHLIVPEKMKSGWLLLSSYVFCLTYGKESLAVLIISTVVSYLAGLLLERIIFNRKKDTLTIICLWSAILLLLVPMFAVKINRFSMFSVIGVSFYTLQEIGYLTDIYRGKCPAEKNLIHYALFVAFFPKLVSGPIERSDTLLAQIRDGMKNVFDYGRVRSGLLLMWWGYVQKTIIADSFAGYVESVYGQWESYSGAMLILASVLFAIQLYADFSGYTNIAIGAAQVLGFSLQDNFRQPYLAISIKDFWRRWHISLSSWLRDYIYIPLGGNRKGRLIKYVNLMITFAVSGLWHGTGLNYLAWGMLHGVYQIAGEYWQKFREKAYTVTGVKQNVFIFGVLRRTCICVLVNIAWVFFRASGLRAALGILKKWVFEFQWGQFAGDLFNSLQIGMTELLLGGLCILILFVVDLLHQHDIHVRMWLFRQHAGIRWFCYMAAALLLTFVGIRNCGIEASHFIYGQF